MVRHTFSSGMLYGPNRRSLRSDKATYVSDTQMSTDSNNWKNSLPSARRASLPPFSNGHHLRSSKLLEKSTKTTGQNDTLEVQCNGVNSSHSYDTRFGGRGAEQNHQKCSPARKCNHWDGALTGKPKRTRTSSSSSSSCLNLPESDQLSPTAGDVSHKLRSRHVWFSDNLSITSDVEDSSRHPCTKQYDALHLTKGIQDYKDDFNDVLTGNDLNVQEEKVCRNSDSKHCQRQAVKRKRLSAEEKLIEDNKAYYKLEVKNCKLRSSGYYIHQSESSASIVDEDSQVEVVPKETVVTCNGGQIENVNVKDEKKAGSTEVKRNKIRLSELSLLNNEAENFMFGEPVKNDDCSSVDSDYGDNKSNLGNNGLCCSDAVADDSKNNNGMESDQCRSSLNDSRVGSKEKNRTDNDSKEIKVNIDHEYDAYPRNDTYKNNHFTAEISFQQKSENPFLVDSEYEENGFEFCSFANSDGNSIDNLQRQHRKKAHIVSQVHSNVDSCKCEVSDLQPCMQIQTFPQNSLKMQNKLENENKNDGLVGMNSERSPCRSENVSECLLSSKCDKRELRLSCLSKAGTSNENRDIKMKPSDKYPDIKNGAVTGLHFSFEAIPESEPWFQTYQRQDEGEEFYLSNVDDCTYWKSFLLPYEMPPDQFNTLTSSVGVPKTANVGNIKRRKRKKNSNLLDKKPRKSPRCHASTLAILSSLMHRKRKDSVTVSDDNLSRSAEEDTNDSSITVCASDSSQQKGMKELAQNIDQLLGLYTEIGLSSESQAVSSNEVSDEMNCGRSHKLKTLKYKRPHKSVHTGISKKSESDSCMKECEGTDVDPVVLEQLAGSGENPLSCVDDLSIRNRGGPSMDVISLLNGYGNCCCVEELMKCKDVTRLDSNVYPSLKERCSSSLCALSTGETMQFKDVVRVKRGKKRKRKKNLTGWPVEKQKLKRRLLLKLARPDLQPSVPETKETSERLAVNEGDVSTSGPNKNQSVPCVEGEGCNDESAKQSEANSVVDTSSRINNEVCVENTSKKTNNLRYNDVDTGTEMKILDDEHLNLGDLSVVTSPNRTEKLCMPRSASVDSNSRHCDFQPRVRVKKMNSVDDINFVFKSSGSVSSVNNTRQLRSASFSSSATLRKNSCHYDSLDTLEVVRRASARMKKSCSRWDSWSTRRRR